VYLLKDDPPEMAHPEDFALGYRLHNSMFGRQFLHLWAYGLRRGDRIKLKDLPALLNNEAAFYNTDGTLKDPTDDGWFCNGFDAAFVGAKATDGFTDLMGDRLVNEFLPLGPVDPGAELPGLPGVTFGEFIPAQRMGDLYDDMCRFRTPGSTYPDFKGLFVEITRGEKGIEVVGSKEFYFEQKLSRDHPIVLSVDVGWAPASAGPFPEERKAPAPPRVPWGEFSRAITELARAKRWYDPPCLGRISEHWFDFAHGLLVRLNGELPGPWPFVNLLAEFARRNEHKIDEFERTIGLLYQQLVDNRPLRDGSATPGQE
jgi:hypothetical protein